MELVTNSKALLLVLNDKINNAQLIDYLNEVIDEELNKEEPDCNLIDDCVNALYELEDSDDISSAPHLALTSESIRKMVSPQRISWRNLNRSLRIAIIAAIIATGTLTVNAAVGEITGKSIVQNVSSVLFENKSNAEDEGKNETSALKNDKKEATTDTESTKGQNEAVLVESTNEAANEANGYVVKMEVTHPNDFSSGKKSYSKKGNSFDQISYKYLVESPSELAQNFNEKEYMQDYYPINICYENDEKEHTFSEWQITKKPTCGVLGEKVRTCNVCGWKQTCPIKATGKHSFEYDAAYGSPTEGKDSLVRARCVNCSVEAQATLPAPKYIVLDTETIYYNGNKTAKPKIIAVLDRNGYEIPKKYYKAEYDRDLSCSKNNYVSASFNNTDLYSGYLVTRYTLLPPDIDISSISASYGTVTVKLKKPSFATEDYIQKYEIQYSASKSFKNSKSVTASGVNSTTASLLGLSPGKTYYIRARASYTWNKSTRLNGRWSPTYSIKIN